MSYYILLWLNFFRAICSFVTLGLVLVVYIYQITVTNIYPANKSNDDARITTAEDLKQVWVMINPTVPRSLFVEKCKSMSLVAVKNLINYNKSTTMFFYSNYRSAI